MSSFGIRPHFSEILDLNLEEAQARIIREVQRVDDRCEVKSFDGFICLRIPRPDRHFWSPRLNLALNSTDDGKAHLQGVYGPNANVWSLFLYGYLMTGSVGLFSGIFGIAQYSLEGKTWGLWVFGASLAVAAGLYILAQFGQKLGAAQTFRLHQIYESAMGRSVNIH